MPSFVPAVCLALVVAFFPLPAAAQPWNGLPFAAEPKAVLAAAEAVNHGEFDVVVLLDELHYVFDANGRATASSRVVFRVADESAVDDWSTVETEWAPWYQERPVIRVRVIAKDGTVHTLSPDAIVESAARDESGGEIFSDNRMLRAPLPGMAAGSVVEQLITYRSNPLFDAGTGARLMFGRYVPVERTRLIIDAPTELAIRYVNRSSPPIEAKKSESAGRQQTIFETGRIEPLKDLEWNLPYDESSVPYVAFSTGTSWQDAARRYTEIVEKQIGDPALVKPFLTRAIGKSTERKEIVDKALAAIQRTIRYAGVEVGEGSFVPRTPSQVLALQYGDCKDKATLLVAMLRAAGIPAHVALLSAGTGLDIDADLPGLSGFNHMIVRVGGEEPFWVDPTDEFSPAGVLPIGDQDRLALIAGPDTTGLTRTPAALSEQNFTREVRTFILADEGKADLTEVTEAKGSHDSVIRRFAAETDRKVYRESMKTYAVESYDAESLKDLAYTDPRDLTQPFRLTLQIEKASRGQTGDIDAAVGIFPASLIDALPWSLRVMPDEDDPEAPRRRDFVISAPYVKEFQYRIVPPPGFVARTLPVSETRALGTASLSTRYETAPDGVVLATLRFDSGKRRLTPAEMVSTRKAVSEVAASNAVIIGFDSLGWSKLNAGDIGGAIAEFRKLAVLHPKEARHHVQIGRAYFVGGMGEMSRQELRRAATLEPDYAPAYRFLGMVLQHDLLAREFRKGFDLEGAREAYRKARELAPKDVEIRSELAKLLSRGSDGELFSRGAKLEDAIAEYEAVAALDDHRFEGELLTAMAHAGRFDEMKRRARLVKDENQRLTALVVAMAATDGVEAAMREAASADTNVRRAVLTASFPTLVHLRLYAQAAAILEQASQGAPNAAQTRPLMDILKRTRRYEEMPLGADPTSLVQRIALIASTEPDLEKAIRGDVASWVLQFEDKLKAARKKGEERPARIDARIIRGRQDAMKQGLPMRVTSEIGMAAMDFSQEGSEETGFRVRMRPRVSAGNAPLAMETFYVVRENGRYVVAAASPASVAITVLHFVEQGELESARVWLNWVREGMSAGGGDDRLAGAPFPSLWPKAKSAASADEIRAAAAVLLVTDEDYASVAVERLLVARPTVPEAHRVRIDMALAAAYAQMESSDEFLAVTRRIAEAAPESPIAFSMLAGALSLGGHSEETRRMAQARLAASPNDADALRVLASDSALLEEFSAANEYLRQIVQRSDGEAGDYNNLAWNALFLNEPLDKAIEDANQAVAMSSSWGIIHTLAAVYAEAGNSLEARTKLLEAMDLAGHEDPSSVDWYVLGRIAENYGANDAALAAYDRVTRPSRAGGGSTYALAQRRLQGLRKKK